MQCPNKPRSRRAAGLIALLAMVTAAHAVDFDEKLKAPTVASAAAFKATAESFHARMASLKEAGPRQLLTDPVLSNEQFDLLWQLQRAADARLPLTELQALGIQARPEGGYTVDVDNHPGWQRLDSVLTGMLPAMDREGFSAELRARGFRDQDLAVLWDYVGKHDARRESSRRSLPQAISFSRLVKKYDRLKLAIPDSLVMSYLYQRGRTDAAAQRDWVNGLLASLDAQAGRILLSYFAEMKVHSAILPDDVRAGIDSVLRSMRLPDFEKLAAAEVNGGAS